MFSVTQMKKQQPASPATANAYLMRVFKGDEKRVEKFVKQVVTLSNLGHPGGTHGTLNHSS